MSFTIEQLGNKSGMHMKQNEYDECNAKGTSEIKTNRNR